MEKIWREIGKFRGVDKEKLVKKDLMWDLEIRLKIRERVEKEFKKDISKYKKKCWRVVRYLRKGQEKRAILLWRGKRRYRDKK